MKILVTGPAGYIGSKLVPKLLEIGHEVIGLDSLAFGYHTLIPYLDNKRFKFIKDDILNIESHNKLFTDIDGIIHLAAIVGFPACQKEPELATKINLESTKKIINLKKNDAFFIYASTCSNYGHRGTNEECYEDTPLKPLSLYGTTKVDSEKYILEKPNSVALRFATAFGISSRLRLDLLANNFVISAITKNKIEIYESYHRRSFVHVTDIADSICFAVDNYKKMEGEAFNVGDKNLNITKLNLAEMVDKYVGCEIITIDGEDADQRDYIINFEKINSIGFKCKKTLEEGIQETSKVLKYLIDTKEFESFKKFYENI
jgi:nucleoside-diphosphate-sugar epimerase